jgi:phosphoglycolate phosphatase-like HAD superfamily hydrolase
VGAAAGAGEGAVSSKTGQKLSVIGQFHDAHYTERAVSGKYTRQETVMDEKRGSRKQGRQKKGPGVPKQAALPLLVLDFDGVICDSIEECFASSWTAYHVLHRKDAGRQVPPGTREEFARMRPFIRTGEDFPLIQELLANGETVKDQAGFDAAARARGSEKMQLFRALYYQARTTLLEEHREQWLSMNRLYPHMARALKFLLPSAPFFILSTKKTSFITEVLDAAGIAMPVDRILFTEHEPKLVTVERLRAEGGFPEAYFVEDQIDSISFNTNPLIKVRLAAWGYVREEWLAEPRAVTVLTPEEFLAFVEKTWPRS